MDHKLNLPASPADAGTSPAARPCSLSGRIFRRRLREAEELLSGNPPVAIGLPDSLDCGKLGKLLRYLRQGAPCLLTVTCYAACALQ